MESSLKEERFSDLSGGEKLMDCMNILITGYGYVMNLFPIVKQMDPAKQDYNTCMKSVFGGLMFVFLSYTFLTFLSVRIYG